ncbi:MAG: cobalamin biosynthesis protein CobD [Prevotella sp.]|nr:cobalamin biosynthesis protein CobD [Prevotella sp.]
MCEPLLLTLPLLIGWMLDLLLGDPPYLPHPIVGFGKMISMGEHRLNKGSHRKLKGGMMAVIYILLVFGVTWIVRHLLYQHIQSLGIAIDILIVFFCLAGTTLIREVRQVFVALDRSLEEGRQQVARIVGRDTSELSAQEVRTAALETLAENLSDGVIAPLFWFALLGTPGMLAYKMVNTLDSMIGYRTQRYKDFGCWAAHIDDVANYLPARLTALLMVLVTGRWRLIGFVWKNGRRHASPNSGYPEAALAGILNCRFGGPHYYFGELIDKPYIGDNDRELSTDDARKAISVNCKTEVVMVVLVLFIQLFVYI